MNEVQLIPDAKDSLEQLCRRHSLRICGISNTKEDPHRSTGNDMFSHKNEGNACTPFFHLNIKSLSNTITMSRALRSTLP